MHSHKTFFTPAAGGLQRADIRVRLKHGDRETDELIFLVDSGASRSLLPRSWVADVFSEALQGPEVDLGLKDLHGKPVMGQLLTVDIVLVDAPNFPVTTDEIGVIAADSPYAVAALGLTWFKQVDVIFYNSPSYGYDTHFLLEI